jgi:hypothetical protein
MTQEYVGSSAKATFGEAIHVHQEAWWAFCTALPAPTQQKQWFIFGLSSDVGCHRVRPHMRLVDGTRHINTRMARREALRWTSRARHHKRGLSGFARHIYTILVPPSHFQVCEKSHAMTPHDICRLTAPCILHAFSSSSHTTAYSREPGKAMPSHVVQVLLEWRIVRNHPPCIS